MNYNHPKHWINTKLNNLSIKDIKNIITRLTPDSTLTEKILNQVLIAHNFKEFKNKLSLKK
jgi:hypothetical protein